MAKHPSRKLCFDFKSGQSCQSCRSALLSLFFELLNMRRRYDISQDKDVCVPNLVHITHFKAFDGEKTTINKALQRAIYAPPGTLASVFPIRCSFKANLSLFPSPCLPAFGVFLSCSHPLPTSSSRPLLLFGSLSQNYPPNTLNDQQLKFAKTKVSW